MHPKVSQPVAISGKTEDDAKNYQEKAIQRAMKELNNERK